MGITKQVNVEFTQSGAGGLKTSLTELNQGLELVRKAAKALGAAFKFAKKGAVLADAEAAFIRMGGSAKILDKQLKLLGNTISKGTLISQQNMSKALGVTTKQFEALLPIARAASKVLGTTVKKSLEDLNLGLARGSKKILDNQGLLVDFVKAENELASALGKVRSELTATEVSQAKLNEVQRAGKVLIDASPVLSVAEAYQQLEADADNATEAMMRAAAAATGTGLVGAARGLLARKRQEESARAAGGFGGAFSRFASGRGAAVRAAAAQARTQAASAAARQAALGGLPGQIGGFFSGAAANAAQGFRTFRGNQRNARRGGRGRGPQSNLDFVKGLGSLPSEGIAGILPKEAGGIEDVLGDGPQVGPSLDAFNAQKVALFNEEVSRAKDRLASVNAEMGTMNAAFEQLNQPIGQTIVKAAQSMESAFASAAVAAIMMGEGFTEALNNALQSIAIEAAVRSAFNFAMAFAFTSVGQHGAAINALAAAKGFAAVAVVAGVGAAATGGFGGGSRGSSGGPSSPSAAGERQFGNSGGGGGGNRTVVVNATFEVDGSEIARQSIIHHDDAASARGI